MSKKLTQHKRGSVLIYALILTALLLSSALSLSTLSTYGAQTTRRLVDSIPAYYAAESCLEQLLNRYLVVAEPAHLYLSTDTNIPDTSTPRLQVGNTSSFGVTALGVKATCATSATSSPPNAPSTENTNSVTLTSYGFFGRSIEGLSATITRFTP